MIVIFAVVVVFVAVCLFFLDRALKARQAGRRRRENAIRLAAAAAYAEAGANQRKAARETSSALTTVLPSIQQPEQGPRRVA